MRAPCASITLADDYNDLLEARDELAGRLGALIDEFDEVAEVAEEREDQLIENRRVPRKCAVAAGARACAF